MEYGVWSRKLVNKSERNWSATASFQLAAPLETNHLSPPFSPHINKELSEIPNIPHADGTGVTGRAPGGAGYLNRMRFRQCSLSYYLNILLSHYLIISLSHYLIISLSLITSLLSCPTSSTSTYQTIFDFMIISLLCRRLGSGRMVMIAKSDPPQRNP